MDGFARGYRTIELLVDSAMNPQSGASLVWGPVVSGG